MQNVADLQANAFNFGSAHPFVSLINAFRLPHTCNGSLPTSLADITAKLEPITRAATRAQLEAMSLMGQQARTAFDARSRLMACRTPQDLASVQVQFWQTAARQQVEGAQRIMAAWGSLVTSALPDATNVASPPIKRDILAFSEPVAAMAAASVAAKDDDPKRVRFAAE